MPGYRLPPTTASEHREVIDEGTSARIRMPSPRMPRGDSEEPAHGSRVAVFDVPWIGAVPAAVGLASMLRVPIPGTAGLCLEFSPRGWVPPGGSTSTLFFQDATGKRHLRLDYGYNVKTKSVNYHWNQAGTHGSFGIADHTPAGRIGGAVHQGARYFRHAGRVLVIVGATVDAVSIVRADRPLRRASQVVAGWAAAAMGCRLVGAGGAALGTIASPLGTAIGGIAGCIVGGFGAYCGASVSAGEVFDWAEGTLFVPLEATTAP